MFKVVKIINGKTNVPESMTLQVDSTLPYSSGAIYYYVDGCLRTDKSMASDEPKKYILLDSREENDSRGTAPCYAVNENMIFEVDVLNPANAYAGRTASFANYIGMDYTHVDPKGTTADVLIIDASNALTKGTVKVIVLDK